MGRGGGGRAVVGRGGEERREGEEESMDEWPRRHMLVSDGLVF